MRKFGEYIEAMMNRQQDKDSVDRYYRSLRSLLRAADRAADMGKEYREARDRLSILAEEAYLHVLYRRDRKREL